jgi:hypothetical protein
MSSKAREHDIVGLCREVKMKNSTGYQTRQTDAGQTQLGLGVGTVDAMFAKP